MSPSLPRKSQRTFLIRRVPCRASFARAKAKVKWRQNGPRFLSVAPEITVPSQLYGVGPATDVTVSCRVQAYPSAINYWVKDQVDHFI